MSLVDVRPSHVLRRGEPMSRHSPWRVGGPCEAFVVVTARDGVGEALSVAREVGGGKRTLIGAGTRTVFRDGAVSGAVVQLGPAFSTVTETAEGWWIGGAAPLAWVARVGGQLAKLRFARGSLGASLALDDGWESWVDAVRFVQRTNEHTAPLAEVPGKGTVVFTEALIRRTPREPRAKVPVVASGWFTAPDDDLPHELVRDGGLSGARLRGVLVPAQEPDGLVNLGDGTAKDLAMLHKSIIEKIQEKRGVLMQDRMSWIGRPV